ncbi:hypothetical protein Pfo_021814 [Paulownia fortunei]|nr:hypothetical protein Pfo_021814 [Paulownia fortunei]
MDTLTQDTRGRGKNKRKWKYEEDAKLVEALLDMINLGTYKAENGFKPGYLNYVEKKDANLKKEFSHYFGYRSNKKFITAEKVVWDSYLQSHPTHSRWQNKSFPFYDDLIIQREETNSDTNDIEATMENDLQDFDASISFSSMQSLRNNLMVMADIKKAASVIGNEIAKASQVFSKAIGVDAEILEKRQKIDSEIRKIHNLTIVEVIKAKSHELIDVIFSMTEEGREQLVKAILHDDV